MEGEHVGPFNLGNPGEFTMLELAEVCLPSKFLVFLFLKRHGFLFRVPQSPYLCEIQNKAISLELLAPKCVCAWGDRDRDSERWKLLVDVGT
jgi:hypothetical protein